MPFLQASNHSSINSSCSFLVKINVFVVVVVFMRSMLITVISWQFLGIFRRNCKQRQGDKEVFNRCLQKDR